MISDVQMQQQPRGPRTLHVSGTTQNDCTYQAKPAAQAASFVGYNLMKQDKMCYRLYALPICIAASIASRAGISQRWACCGSLRYLVTGMDIRRGTALLWSCESLSWDMHTERAAYPSSCIQDMATPCYAKVAAVDFERKGNSCRSCLGEKRFLIFNNLN